MPAIVSNVIVESEAPRRFADVPRIAVAAAAGEGRGLRKGARP